MRVVISLQAICITYRNFIVQSLPEELPSNSPVSVSVHDMFADRRAIFDDRNCFLADKNSVVFSNRMRGSSPLYNQYPTNMHTSMSAAMSSNLKVPSLEDIISLYRFIYENCQMEKDVLIASLVYCERLIHETKGAVQPNERNWRSILFSCLALASKGESTESMSI